MAALGLAPAVVPPQESRYLYIQYVGEPGLFHEHLGVLQVGRAPPDDDDWVIATVDGDVYIETATAPPHLEVILGGPRHLLPAGLGQAAGRPVYRFPRALGAPRLRDLRAEALALVLPERVARGLDAEGFAPAPQQLVVPGAAGALPALPTLRPEEGFFVMVGTPTHLRGSEIVLSATDMVVGGFALVAVVDGTVVAACMLRADAAAHMARLLAPALADPASPGSGVLDLDPGTELEDVRTLPVRFEKTGERFRTFDDSVALMTEEQFNEDEWPLEGPRSAAWWLRATRRQGTTPLARHQKWVHESGISPSDRSIHEHELLSQVIEQAATVDQLNVPSLICFESIIRRLQLIEEAHATTPTQPSYEASEHWLGLGRRKGGVLISPMLSKHVAEKVRDETSVLKERRKAREETRLAPKKADHKGNGKGGKNSAGAAGAAEG
jgi:hypothetical protein